MGERTTIRRIGTAVLAAVLMSVAAQAGAEELGGTAIENLDAARSDGSIVVSGRATFVDLPVEVGTDPEGDAMIADIGADLSSARVSRGDPASEELVFAMTIGDMHPAIGGIPEVIHHTWDIKVEPSGQPPVSYYLQALHGSQWSSPGSQGAVFRLVPTLCPGGGTPFCLNLRDQTLLEGEVTSDEIQFFVPMALIGAPEGTSIDSLRIASQVGVSGAAWMHGPRCIEGTCAGWTLDEFHLNFATRKYTVPSGPRVRVGLAPAATAPEKVLLTTAATLQDDGSFSADIEVPEPGSHVLVAEACYGNAPCVREWITLVVE